MSDGSNGSVSEYEVEDLRYPSRRKIHRKLTDIKSIWKFSAIDLKGYKGKGGAWLCVLFKKYFRGRNGTKASNHYYRYVMGSDIKACIVTVPPEMRFYLKILVTKKQMNAEKYDHK